MVLYDRLSEETSISRLPEKARLKIDARKRPRRRKSRRPKRKSRRSIRYDRPRAHVPARDGEGAAADREAKVEIAKRIEQGQILIAKAVRCIHRCGSCSGSRAPSRRAAAVRRGGAGGDGGIAPSATGKKERIGASVRSRRSRRWQGDRRGPRSQAQEANTTKRLARERSLELRQAALRGVHQAPA